MGKGIGKILIGAAIIGAAFVTGGAALLPGFAVAGTAGITSAAVIGAALSTTALGSLVLGIGASIALSGVSQSLAKVPKASLAQMERLNASLVPGAARKIVFGSTAMATDIRYTEPSGTDQEYVDYIIAVASHAVDSIDEIWLEDVQAWTSGGGAQGKYVGYLTVDTRLEGTAANAITINGGSKWGSSRRLTGCAYVHLRIKRTGNTKKADSPFASGLPSRMTIIGRGAKLYDPRRDSTVPGGSGSMRANDQSTWAYAPGGTTIGENLALQSLWYLLGWRINGKLAVGRGIPPDRLNLASFAAAANLCDEPVTLAAGGTERRYEGAGVVSEADDPQSVLQTLMSGCNGRLRDGSGRLSLAILHNDLALASLDPGLNDDDVLSPFTWNPDPSLEQSFNIVRGRFTDPSSASLYQPVPYPEVSLPSTDGIDRALTLDLLACESASRAQRLAKTSLQRKQYQRSFSAVFSARAWKYQVGDVVPLTFAALGFNRRLFRVEQQTIQMDGTCPMVLTEENPAIYAWDADETAAVQPAAPIVYDSRNNPLVQGINDAALTAAWPTVTDPINTKPADNATNSADPASPFGPTGTVAQALQRVVDVQGIITDIQSQIEGLGAADLAALQAELGQAQADIVSANTEIDGVQADLAGALVTISSVSSVANEARAAVTAEAGTRAGADGALGTRIENLTTTVGGNTTAISTEVTARTTATAALGQRIDTLTTTVGGVSASVTSETTARTTADTALGSRVDTVTANLAGTESKASTALVATNTLAGRVDTVEFRQLVRANLQANGGLADASFATNGMTNAPAGAGFGDSPYWGRHYYHGANGTVATYMPAILAPAGEVVTVSFDRILYSTGGTTRVDAALYASSNGTGAEIYSPSSPALGQANFTDAARQSFTFTMPAGRNSLRIRLVQEGVTGQTIVGWRRLKVEFGAAPATLYSDDASDTVAFGRIRSTEVASAGVASRTTDLETGIGGLTGRVSTAESSISNINGTVATLQTTVSAIANPTLNLVTNSTFAQGGAGWSYDGNWTPESNYQQMRWFGGSGATTSVCYSPPFSAIVGAQYSAAVEMYTMGLNSGTFTADIMWLDASDNTVGYSNRTALVTGKFDWSRLTRNGNAGGMACPTGATKGRVRVFLEGASASSGAVAFRRVQIEKSPIIHDWQEGSNADALAAQVTTNAAAIATLQGKLAGAYWQVESSVAGVSAKVSVVAMTSNGSTTSAVEIVARQFSVRTGAGDQPVLSVVGNQVQIAGNLVVSGSIQGGAVGADKLGSDVSRYASASWTGSIHPSEGQSVQVPGFQVALGLCAPKGSFLFLAGATLINTSGPDKTETRNGKPFYTHYVPDGGVVIYAIDNEGHTYSVPLTGQSFQQVLATTPFSPVFIATVSRGNTNSGIIDQGDYYEQFISADYVLTGLSINAAWGAI